MKLSLYKDSLKQTDPEREERKIVLAIKKARLQGVTYLSNLEERVVALEQEITQLSSKIPLNYDYLIGKTHELKLLNIDIETLKDIMADLFNEHKS